MLKVVATRGGTASGPGVQVGARLDQDVVVFVASVDGALGAGLDALPVDPVGEALPVAEIEAVLQLRGHGAGPVADEVAAAQQEAVVAGVRLIQKELPEQTPLQQPGLAVTVLPVVCLGGADGGEVDALSPGDTAPKP